VVTQAELDRCAWLEAQRYLNASYAELAKLACRPQNELCEWRVCGAKEVGLSVVLREWGLRKRVSVEVTLSAQDERGASCVSIVYFERFRSGTLRGPWPPATPSPRPERPRSRPRKLKRGRS
jgi:hypothetical protein